MEVRLPSYLSRCLGAHLWMKCCLNLFNHFDLLIDFWPKSDEPWTLGHGRKTQQFFGMNNRFHQRNDWICNKAVSVYTNTISRCSYALLVLCSKQESYKTTHKETSSGSIWYLQFSRYFKTVRDNYWRTSVLQARNCGNLGKSEVEWQNY